MVRSSSEAGLAAGTTIAIAGHDHLCAALAAGATAPGVGFDSMGTAETLIGTLDTWNVVKERGHDSGLAFGRHVLPDLYYWLGGVRASGGSVEWFRALFDDTPLPYAGFEALVVEAGEEPTGILYFPYLLGRGGPHPDSTMLGALVGLKASHSRAHIAKAVLEGISYEIEQLRRRAEEEIGTPIQRLIAAGGGTRNRSWMQIKADISGLPITLAPTTEATVVGAALLAGIGSGLYNSPAETLATLSEREGETIYPDTTRHRQYRRLYKEQYLALQELLLNAETP
jgi:xylulokinase